MPNGLSNQSGEDPLWHFISRKSNRFYLKFGKLINLIFRFYVHKYGFCTLSDGCHGNKNSIFVVAVTTNQEIQICELILYVYFIMMNNS